MYRTHVAAFVALLEADAALQVTQPVEDETRPEQTPYVAVRPGVLLASSETLGPVSDRVDGEIQAMYVGVTGDEVLWAMQHARAAVLDRRLPVAGRTSSPIRLAATTGMSTDDDAEPSLHWVSDRFEFYTLPA